MKKPFIGLTPSNDTETNDLKMRPTYIRALTAAGAIPAVLPLTACNGDLKQLVETFDGFLFTGGPDVHPFLFGEETHARCGSVSSRRDQMELLLLSLVMEAKKPILGICRGVQLINIGLGGTIWQDIGEQTKGSFSLAHSQPFSFTLPSHKVALTANTRLFKLSGRDTLAVNSMHHQAVRDVAPDLTISAVSSDSLTEAVEMTGYPFLIGVQWHPEYLWKTDPAAFRLFQEFVNACRRC